MKRRALQVFSELIFKYELAGTGQPDPAWTSPDVFFAKGVSGLGTRTLAVVDADLYAGGLFWPVGFPSVPAGGGGKAMLVRMDAASGAVKAVWNTGQEAGSQIHDTPVNTLLAVGDDLYVGGEFTRLGDETRFGLGLLAMPEAPTMGREPDGRITVFINSEDGSEITHFQVVAVSGGNCFQNDGTTPVRPGDFISVGEGLAGLRFVSTNGGGGSITLVSAVDDTPAGAGTVATTLDLSVPQPPVLRFSGANYSTNEGGGFVEVTLQKFGAGASSVNYTTFGVTATETDDYGRTTNQISFASLESSKTIVIPIFEDGDTEGDEVFGITLTDPAGAHLVYPRTATITIVDNDAVIRLINPRQLSDGSFEMTLLGEGGRVYSVESSPALSNWSTLVTLTNFTGSINVVDRQATNSNQRLYRAREWQ